MMKKKESSFVIYTDYNNLYGKAISEELSVDGFGWVDDISEVDENVIKNYDEDSNVGYFIKADIKYPKKLHNKDSDLPFLPERMKVNKCKKLVCNLYDKKRLCRSYKIIRTSIKSWIKNKKDSWSIKI